MTDNCCIYMFIVIQGCHGQGIVRENSILFKVREKSGSFVSGQEVSKSLFEVSEKSRNFYVKVTVNYFILCFCMDKVVLCLFEPSLFLLIHGQNSHPAGSVKMA